MRASTAIHLALRTRLSAVVLASLAVPGAAIGQPIQLVFGTPPPVELAAPQVALISGTTAARLEQARALASEKNWNEAIDIWRELAVDDSGRVVGLDDRRFVTLRAYCHLQLARLSAAGLAVYRRRVDPLAEQWFREGLAARDERELRRVVDELYCSSWGDDALMALGDLALERGDYAAARRSWEQVSPLLRDTAGQPIWLSLRDIDLDAHWPQIERRWLERPKASDWLAYPDTQLDLADVRARLVLVSIRAGELDRAALELEVFRRFHPTSVGRLGGQEGPYVAALARLLSSAREWPAGWGDANWATFAGSQTRSCVAPRLGSMLVPAWTDPVQLTAAVTVRGGTQFINGRPFGGKVVRGNSDPTVRESERPLSCFPIVVDGVVVFSDAATIRAVDLATGGPAITADGILGRNESTDESNALPTGIGRIAHGVPRFTLSARDGVVFGRVGRLATTQINSQYATSGDRLVGLDLARDGLLTFRARPDDAKWSFDGAPVSDGRRVFVAMRRSDVTPAAHVACFDAATGVKLWTTSIGAADTPAAGRGDEITHNLLTLVEDRIYFNSNLGVVASLDVEQGRICWLHRYDRLSREKSTPQLTDLVCVDRDPSPCVFHDGLLIVAPADTQSIFALDADTGRRVWTNGEVPDALHLLGVVRQTLVVSGHRLRSLDVRSGAVRFAWPDGEHAGIRGMGRGLVAGDEIFWPTRHEIYVINVDTGTRTRAPISLAPVSDCGANLAAAHGYLIAAGHDKLMAYGPKPAPKPDQPNQDKSVATTD